MRASPLLSSGSIDFLGFNLQGGNNDLINLTISRISGSQGVVSGTGGSSIAVSWEVNADNTPDNWTASLSWPASFDNGNGTSSLNVWSDNGAGFNQIAGPITASGDPRVSQNFTINSFSVFTVADATVVLPVELTEFNVAAIGDRSARLSWSTLSELNSDYFEVERSSNGTDFFPRGKIKAANYSSRKIDYHFTDTEVTGTEVFYRLRMTDLDGTYEYSEILYLQLEDDMPFIYPNPASDHVLIPLASSLQNGKLTLYDQGGREVLVNQLTEEKMDLSNVRAGVYIYRLQVGNVYQTGKLIVR